jgi:hypothetical protein
MAVPALKLSPARQEEEAREKRQAEALERLADARREKTSVVNDHQNAYYYTHPRRIRRQDSTSTSAQKPGDDRQLQTSFGSEVVDDYMTMLIETFTPREGPWAERKMPTEPDEDGQEHPEVESLNKLIQAEDAKIFDLIKASNYYSEKAKAGVPDAAIGVVALLIKNPGRGQPIQCLGVPIRELDMDMGPDGRIDFRSITRPSKWRHIPALLGKEIVAKLPDEQASKLREKKNDAVTVVWAWWRNWENFGDVEWQHVVLLDNKLVHEATFSGDGSCPLVVGRFGATPDFAWPDGPLLKSLPDLVQLDEISGALIENIDFTLRPPKAYEDDGTINIPVDGIEPGMLLPKRPSGGQTAFEDIYEPRPVEAALFDVDRLEHRIRRLHYVDFPEQRGKTPPTATQWVDELTMRQRRIGTPGYAFWREEPYETFQRFRYLGERRGSVTPLVALGVPSNLALNPYNPAERAQDSQDIATAVRFGEIGIGMFPQTWQVAVDEMKSLKNLQAKTRDKIFVFRSEGEVKERIALLGQLGTDLVGNGGAPGGGEPQ